MGSSVLMLGAGPTGLMLTQMLRQNGGCHVVVAAPEGLKMNLAKSLDAADEYVELSRKDPAPQFEKLKSENPYGFDIVVEATGSVKILEDAINYVRRGGKLVVYGVYGSKDRVSWPPVKICESNQKLSPRCLSLMNVLFSPQSVTKSQSLALSAKPTSFLPQSTTSIVARSRSKASSIRLSSWSSGRSASRR
jgi:threonine dehydrogenase-like Zn-dependent dehydrogenase